MHPTHYLELTLPLPAYAPGTKPATSISVHGISRLPSAARPWEVGALACTNEAGSTLEGAAHQAGPMLGSMVVKGAAPT